MDVFDAEKRSAVMRAIRSKDTKPEIAVRSALHRLGFRFRLHRKDLPGKPDIVMPSLRVAVQVRGCFWHQHSCHDGRIPGSRQDYWIPKLQRNVERDRGADDELRALGWVVIVIWECQCAAKTLPSTIEGLAKQLLVVRRTLRGAGAAPSDRGTEGQSTGQS
ncbi:very short patch repair endonuclease [Paraburkholderia unamae]|uniref:very short patch repair endonuclease n=1 Tax=Paraburkholderia unamae TaxID=219649 RepID=UPI001CC53496|nr:very short patch repair endonuclease [Paraburkholderia unamae]